VDLDIRDRAGVFSLFKSSGFDLIIHCAAQPSHDKARDIPLIDFDVNAVGTINLLEATRQSCPEAVFIHMSTNKVYGDAPNELPLVELERRYDYAKPEDFNGISEECRIDRSLHSLFGASKLAGDGRAGVRKILWFEGGHLSRWLPDGSGPLWCRVARFHLVSDQVALDGGTYNIFGYKGKQVGTRFIVMTSSERLKSSTKNPRPGEAYNIGGGRENSASVLECIDLIEQLIDKKISWTYVEQNRIGDHICYISDLRKLRSHFPGWNITRSLTDICTEIISAQRELSRKQGA
jgi:CDP-paratose 2-epimerase